MIMQRWIWVLLACSAAWSASNANAQSRREDPNESEERSALRRVEELRASWQHEPTPNEAVQAALRNFRVHPEALDELRSNARLRAAAPILSAGYRRGGSRNSNLETRTITDPAVTNGVANYYDDTFNVGASWDTREAVFNGDQVQIYGLVGVQRDLMLEVLRAYFARRQLALTLQVRPPSDPLALAMLMLRVDEFTAVIDILTGGWFTRTVEERRTRRTDAR